jgi:ferritin
MISEKIQKGLNDQLNFELYSAYIYMSMSAALESMGLPGFANWMRIQTQEEVSHAYKFYHHLLERGSKVKLAAIPEPKTEWPGVLDIFKDALAHEQIVTGRINDLVDLAIKEKDHASNMFLQWFVSEQVEEEASVEEIIQKLKLSEDAKGVLFMLDKEMGTRVFTPPAQGE